MTVDVSIERLRPDQRALRDQVAALHVHAVPYGDLAKLGQEVVRDFYHGILLDDPDFVDVVYLVDGVLAGFGSFSRDIAAVRRRALRRAWPRIVLLLLKACLRDPRRIRALYELSRTVASDGSAEPVEEQPAPQALSLAVEERFRTVEFYRRSGLRIGRELYLHGGRELYLQGARHCGGQTRVDNPLAHATLRSLGWRRTGTAHGGRDYLWVWDLEAAARRFGFGGGDHGVVADRSSS